MRPGFWPKIQRDGLGHHLHTTLLPLELVSFALFFFPLGHSRLLICTLTSENLVLEKSRSVSNLGKISGPGNLDFFLDLHLERKARFIL